MIAFLGMGLLGSNFVRALRKRGEEVQVWNRTPEKAKALEADGAKAFAKVDEAVKGAERIHITLKDDDSVNSVLQQALPGLKAGAIIIDHTTTSSEGALERSAHWKEKGFIYLHAPVFMGPPNALESSGYMLVSGDPAVISRVEGELSKMTGKLLQFGAKPNTAAGIKLIGNLFLISLTAGLSDVLSLSKDLGIPTTDVAALFNTWNPGALVSGRLHKMLQDDFTHPSWELQMARKDARLMIEASQKGPKPLTVIPAVAELMDHWIEKGHSNEDWMIISRGK